MIKGLFDLKNILCTLFILLSIYLLSNINLNTSILDPLDGALKDFELTDLVFSQMRHSQHATDSTFVVSETQADTNVVIVNIGKLTRGGIADELNEISKYNPKVIGIDAFFRHPKDSIEDLALQQAIKNAHNVVLVSKLSQYNETTQQFDSIEHSNPMFSDYSDFAFANLITESDEREGKTSRTFNPVSKVKNKDYLCFPLKIAEYYNPSAVKKILDRKKDVEVINFRGNLAKYHVLDIDDVFDPEVDKSFLRGKIVLMGFVGESIHESSWEDMFYSPLNHKYVGKAYPDIYGIVIHANIISMTLAHDFIDESPSWLTYLFSIILCHLNVVVFHYFLKRHGIWYGVVTKGLQLLQSVILIIVILVIFDKMNYKLELSLAFAVIVLAGDLVEIWFDGVMNFDWKKMFNKLLIKTRITNITNINNK